MSEPAKDEVELVGRISCAIMYLRGSDVIATAAIAAIRAAGWTVVPAWLTENMVYDALRAENVRLREALDYAEAAAKGMASSIRTTLEVKP
jgi:hypothetical protein